MAPTSVGRIIAVSVLATLLTVAAAKGQPRPRATLGELFTQADSYFIEALPLPERADGSRPDRQRLLLLFRLTHDLLTFRAGGGGYVATPGLFVEAIDGDGVIVARASWRDTVETREFGSTNSRREFAPGVIELAIRPGRYTIRYEYDDGQPGAGFREELKDVRVGGIAGDQPQFGGIVMIRGEKKNEMTAAAVDGNAIYGERARILVPMRGERLGDGRWELFQIVQREGREEHRSLRSGLIRTIDSGVTITPATRDGEIELRLAAATGEGNGFDAGWIEFGTDDLPTGPYLLTLTADGRGTTVTDSARFQIRWVTMPLSLGRVDYAIRSLAPIADDATLDSLSRGNTARQREALESFWRRFDPTPSTHFNEAMAEYYRRVDEAYFAYRTLQQTDGSRTDRGRIYILNGPPTEIERRTPADRPAEEIWTYRNRVGQVFIFRDDSGGGEYRLVAYRGVGE